MKAAKKKRENSEISPEEAMKQLQKLFKERGTKALEMARKEMLQEKIDCKEAREAIKYFMTKYWHDLARPTLLSVACEAVGGDPELTTPIAVPMILISGAIDIHDDIIDQSKIKNDKPTVYGKFGKDIALLVGDALLFKGLTLLNEASLRGIPQEKGREIINIMKNMFFELGDAEALELQLRGHKKFPPEKYIHIVKKKAADVEAHTRISASLGGGSKREIEALSEYGRLLGMLIILRDDWIDMIDLEESVHRIKKECLPLPLLYALKNPKIRPEINGILKKKRITKKDAEAILRVIYNSGGFRQYEKLTKKLAQDAFSRLTLMKFRKQELGLFIRAMTPQVNKTIEFLSPPTS
jgi:geranylgeranyl pyrophosphate synthase